MAVGHTPDIVIRAGGSVVVEGWDSDRVQASSDSRWGLKIEQRNEAEIGRARAKVGEHVLFDIRINAPRLLKRDARQEVTEVQIGGVGEVKVPMSGNVKVYASKSVEVRNVSGRVSAFAGHDIRLQGVRVLVNASAGGNMDLDCDRVEGDRIKFGAGRDLRFCIRELNDAKFMINDLGGYWEAVLGEGRIKIRLDAGGDVTLATDQEVIAQPPYYTLGRIEKPSEVADES
jgi:hypothetical protein